MVSVIVPLGLLAAAIGAGYVLVLRRLTGQLVVSHAAGAVSVLPVIRVLVAGLVVAGGSTAGLWTLVTMLAGLAAGQVVAVGLVLLEKGRVA